MRLPMWRGKEKLPHKQSLASWNAFFNGQSYVMIAPWKCSPGEGWNKKQNKIGNRTFEAQRPRGESAHKDVEDVLLVELMYLVFTRMPGESLPLVEFMYLVYTRMPSESLPLVEFMYLVFTRMPGESLPLVEFMYLVFTCMPGESYRRRLRSLLLYLCCVFRALINSPVCWLWIQKNCDYARCNKTYHAPSSLRGGSYWTRKPNGRSRAI